MVNVTKSNFLEKSQDLIDRLPSAAFAAIDLGEYLFVVLLFACSSVVHLDSY